MAAQPGPPNRVPRALTWRLLVLVLVAAGCGQAANPNPTGPPPATAPGAGALPDALTFAIERAAVAEALVTYEAGGLVSATAADGTTFALAVPPAAVPGDTQIRMTPLTEVRGVTDPPGAVHAVQLEPEGLLLFEFARLTITPAAPIPVGEQMAFEAAGDGANPAPAIVDPGSEPIVLLLEHFSVGGVAQATPAQRATFLQKSASNAERRIAGEVRERLSEERQRQLLGGSDGGTPDLSDLTSEFEREVVDKRKQAAALSCDAVMLYLRTVISFERQLQLLGLSAADEAASLARVASAVAAMDARYQECEKEAIAKCQAAKDHKILISFWLAMERPADPDRAKQTCEPQGYQFEMIGTGTGYDTGYPVPIEWEVWGLLCKGSEEWKIWENFEGVQGSSSTGGPRDPGAVPYLVKFDEQGAMTGISWAPLGGNIPQGTTASGNTFQLLPGDRPTTVAANLNAGAGVPALRVTAPVKPADGSFGTCEQTG